MNTAAATLVLKKVAAANHPLEKSEKERALLQCLFSGTRLLPRRLFNPTLKM